MKRLGSWLRNPTYVLAVVGLSGFAVDMFWRPISNAGLILLGVACAPWITRLVKSAKVAGIEFELAESAPPKQTAERLADEVTGTTQKPSAKLEIDNATHDVSSSEPIVAAGEEAGAQPARPAEPMTGSGGLLFAPNQNLALAYLLEGLVLQDLQRDLGGFIQREVRLPSDRGREAIVDGLIVRDGEAVAVEVKLFVNRPPTSALIDQAINQARKFSFGLRRMGYKRTRAIVAVVVGQAPTPAQLMDLQDSPEGEGGVSVKVFRADDLLATYGFRTE